MSNFCNSWKQANTKRWICVSSAIVLPITIIGLVLLLEYVLRTPSDFSEAHSFTGEFGPISINKISNCDSCDSLLLPELPMTCSADHTWVNGSILVDTPWAFINSMNIGFGFPGPMQTPYFATLETPSLNRTGSRLIEMHVCVNEKNCSLCGSRVFEDTEIIRASGQISAMFLLCEQGWEGNQVKLTQLNNREELLQPCRLEIWGMLAVTEGVRNLDTFYAVGKSKDPFANTTNTTDNTYDFAVSNVIEGLWNTEARKCFISAAEEGGDVMIDIPWSMVTHVELLNGIDNAGKMEGLQVFVCRFPGNKCLPCGVAATTDPEKWASVYCTAGWVEGNQIKVTHSYEVLQFCEIQVFGQEFEDTARAVMRFVPKNNVIYAIPLEHVGDHGSMEEFPLEQQLLSRRGEVDVTTQCYRLTFEADLKYNIGAKIALHYVQLVNCPSPGCGSTGGAKVCASWSCDPNILYSDCVKTEDSLPGERYTLLFPEKPTTNEVFFVAEYFSTRAELCRVEIFGEMLEN